MITKEEMEVRIAVEKKKVWKHAIAVAKKSAKATHGKTFDNTSALMIVEALEAARTADI